MGRGACRPVACGDAIRAWGTLMAPWSPTTMNRYLLGLRESSTSPDVHNLQTFAESLSLLSPMATLTQRS